METREDVLARLQENEAIYEKFFQVEKRILSILNFRDLFNVLLTEIESVFRLPAAWLALIEDCDAARLIPVLEAEERLASRLRCIGGGDFAVLLGAADRPLLLNRNLGEWAGLFPRGANWHVASLAVIPISLDGAVIGSLNLGDSRPERFSPDKDAVHLHHLGVKVSLCLSNVTAHEKLAFMAYHDALTGLLNRRVMIRALEREVDRAGRYRHPLSVVFIDVDDFKTVNDTYGHECGDALLRRLADILAASSRASDIAARFAGDEFVLILPESGAEAARRLMERVCEAARNQPLETAKGPVAVKISFGVASLEPGRPDTPEAMLERADRQLYRAKRGKKPGTGRQPGRVLAFEPPPATKKP